MALAFVDVDMNSSPAPASQTPDFEIDQPEIAAQFLLSDRREIFFYLNALAQRRTQVTAYIDAGQDFFLTSVLAVDDQNDRIFLDPAQMEHLNRQACAARNLTLTAALDRVKIQCRIHAPLERAEYLGRHAIVSRLPTSLLRLQRREFFRLEPPPSNPIYCQLTGEDIAGRPKSFKLRLGDISGGGLSLIAATDDGDYFPRDSLFRDCRLDIPGEGILMVNLLTHKAIEISSSTGEHRLRIGCEFVNLPASRQAVIERYITRIERERKASSSAHA